MILSPPILALTVISLLVSAFMAGACAVGGRIARHWDMASGSELQLALERQTYLVSTLLSYVLGVQLLSLFLFAYTGEHLHTLFRGAMCAAGTFNVNGYGYPALVLKLVNFLACGLWLIVNAADNRAVDYPLVRTKYRALLPLTASVILEGALQLGFFASMKPDLMTSCCGSLFGAAGESVANRVAALPPVPAMALFFASAAVLLRLGATFLATGRGARPYGWASAWFLLVSFVSIISFISLYFYELPTHHCPFCILQGDYHGVGYPLYAALLTGGVCGMGAGVLEGYRRIPSLRGVVPSLQRGLCIASLAGYAVFTALSAYPIVFSDFTLGVF